MQKINVVNEDESFAELIYREGKLVRAINKVSKDNPDLPKMKAELNTIRTRITEIEGASKAGTPIWLM
jgi:hypothetical protein